MRQIWHQRHAEAAQDGMMGPLRSAPDCPRPHDDGPEMRWPGRETAFMQVRWTLGTRPLTLRAPALRPLAPRPLRLATVAVAGGVIALTLPLASCGGGTNGAVKPQACGTGHTAANVPVEIEVNRGQVSCTIALSVQKDYAAAVAAGKAPGNGGGGPVTVDSWKCTGFATPDLLKTGDVSKCVKGGVEF